VKGKKEDKILKDLFRKKLNNEEVLPSPSVNSALMSRLGRKEFFHFIPSKLNIWYIGGLAVAGVSLALLLTSNPKSSENISPFIPSEETTRSEIVENNDLFIVSRNPNAGVREQETIVKEKGNSKRITGKIRNDGGRNTENSENRDVVAPTGIVNTVPENKLYEPSEMNKLQQVGNITENFIEASAVQGCVPLKIRFRNKALQSDSCRWTFGDGGHSYAQMTEWLFDIPGEYNVMLEIFGKNGLINRSAISVFVNPRPLARFDIDPDNANQLAGEITFRNYSTDAVKYSWDFGDGTRSQAAEPLHSYRKSGNYNVTLVATSESGCYDSLIVLNALSVPGYYIDFPNAFIPNPNGSSNGYYSPKSDEAAQVFHPFLLGVSGYQLRIFSRTGMQIFESNDISIGWDGYYKGQLCDPGVYIWKVRGNYVNGEIFTKMGDVTLLKN
jgi:PKD repeat protein